MSGLGTGVVGGSDGAETAASPKHAKNRAKKGPRKTNSVRAEERKLSKLVTHRWTPVDIMPIVSFWGFSINTMKQKDESELRSSS